MFSLNGNMLQEKLEEQYAEAVTRELKHEQSLRASESLADRFQVGHLLFQCRG